MGFIVPIGAIDFIGAIVSMGGWGENKFFYVTL